ncbi:MAG: glycoside hydrolase domain-containing protein [Planctomycetota bacterium]
MKQRIFTAVCLICLIAQTTHAKVFRFDMGSEQSELRKDFTRITAKSLYSKEAGYGWKSADGLKEHHKFYEREWTMNESRGTKEPPRIYTNEITCDTILSDKPNAFLVDVPPGDYTVYLLGGLSAGSARDYHLYEISAGDATASIKIPGPFRFENHVLRTSVKGNQLEVNLNPKTDWLVSCLIVYPTAEEAKVRAEFLDALEREIYFLPPDVAEQWKETKHVDDRPMPEFSQADKDRGYVVFARHWSEIIYPNTVPCQVELNPELAIFASLGEYEPATFTILPLADLKGCKVTASDLRSDKGAIPAANIDIRCVRYMLVRPNYSLFYSYHIAPDVLEHRDASDIEKGCNQRYWVTVKVPDNAAPGIYQGKLTFTPAGGKSADIPLKIRVLPITLRKNPEHYYGMYYRDPLSNVDEKNTKLANEYFQRKAELERQDMVAHGMNTHISHVGGLDRDAAGNWTINGDETERRIALDRKYGMADRPLVVSFSVTWWYSKDVDKRGTGSHLRLVRDDVPQSFFDEVTKMVQAIEAERKKRGWPEFLYYPIDEPSTHEASVKFMVNVMKAIKKVPGVRTYVTADPSHDGFGPMWPVIDIWCCQPFVFGYDKIKKLSKEKNIEFWCYPNHISGENDHTTVKGARMTWGFGFWKSGFKTLIPWIYQSDNGDPWNYLDSTTSDFFNRSTPDGDPIPVAMWEAYREGIDDGRYIHTLDQLVKEAKARGGKAAQVAAECEKELQFVWDAIAVQEKYKYDDLWTGPDFDAYRWLLASKILALQETMR